MAVRSESCVGGGRWRARGDGEGHGDDPRLTAHEEEQLPPPLGAIRTRLAPGAREWRVTRTTAGEKAPERTEEHGDQVQLRDDSAGDGAGDSR